jgi:ubiquinone/menaquinone biosynthesis C-methylase UbiE
MQDEPHLKTDVQDFWNQQSCGEIYAVGQSDTEFYESESKNRYQLEHYILGFAKFNEGKGKDVVEIGVGMGADHVEWAKSCPKSLTGIDLTPRAIEHTKKRLALYGLESNIRVGDAENLSFEDNSFDIVYSWGVLHHSPDTPKAIDEVYRILRPGGTARIMIYQTYSLNGYMLWIRYGLLAGHPFRSLEDIYFHHLESPGTKAYTVNQAKEMCAKFSKVNTAVQLCSGDLLEGEVGQRHRGILLTVAKAIWPRWFFKAFFKNHGLFMLIEAQK